MKIGVHIGKRVHALRKAASMTQDQLADTAQVPQGNISRLERGDVEDVHVSTLLRLARALGATVDDLLRDFEEEEKAEKVSALPSRHH
jgi:transcriptional regulator with XRE-family HTH domain